MTVAVSVSSGNQNSSGTGTRDPGRGVEQEPRLLEGFRRPTPTHQGVTPIDERLAKVQCQSAVPGLLVCDFRAVTACASLRFEESAGSPTTALCDFSSFSASNQSKFCSAGGWPCCSQIW